MESESEDDLDLRHLLAVLRDRSWVIVLVVVVFVVGTYLYSSKQTKLYAATSQVHITNPNADSPFNNSNINFDPKREVQTQSELIQTPEVRDAVDAKLGEAAAEVTSVEVRPSDTADIIDLRVASPSPTVARDAANLYASVYVSRRREQVSQVFDQRAADLRAQAAQLNDQLRQVQERIAVASPADIVALQAQQQTLLKQEQDFETRASQLEAEAASRTGNVEVASSAELPEAPFSPQTRRNTLLAAAIALLLSVGLVLLLDRLDDRVRSPEDAERSANMPVLGSIPIYSPQKKRNPQHLPHGDRSLVPLTSLHAEAYRTLRTSLRFSSLGKGAQVIMVTSSSGSEGKSTVTANLAVALAESGQKVVVISADLRRPVLAGIFDVTESGRGLSTVLINESEPTESMQKVTVNDHASLWVLPAGPIPPNPAEILGSPMMGELLAQLRSAGVDFILIDCPPVLPVADALAISQYADGVIVIAVPGQTRAHNLEESVHRLRQVGARMIGLVLNGVPLTGSRYGYYYQYRRYASDYSSNPATRDEPAVG